MSTLILYATKYGAAGVVAQRIADNLGNAEIHDLKKDVPNLEQFDCVIIGSSIYAGSIRKEAKAFLAKNASLLKGKKIGLFVCGMDTRQNSKHFTDNFPQEIVNEAKATAVLGGIFDPKKANAFERLIIKMISKSMNTKFGYMDFTNDEKIKQFAETMKAN